MANRSTHLEDEQFALRNLDVANALLEAADLRRNDARQDQTGHDMVNMFELKVQRLGRDLHDGIGQVLTSLRIMSEALSKKLEQEGSPHAQRAERMAYFARDALAQMSDVYLRLTPSVLQTDGLPAALSDLSAKTRETTGIVCEFVHDGITDEEDPDCGIHLYRIAQESVRNAIRHGGARRVQIALETDGFGPMLRIEDDGAGFDVARRRQEGLGLQSMVYRASVVAGRLEIYSSPENGTAVICRFRGENHPEGDGAAGKEFSDDSSVQSLPYLSLEQAR